MMSFDDFSNEQLELVMHASWEAYQSYRHSSLSERAGFMKAIAEELERSGDSLIETAMKETNLPEQRLRGERARTILQLNQYAAACKRGFHLDIRISTANTNLNPPKPDIRKMMVPLGPVVVFGASNFPFAYSTAGGDTASALAAGCPVVVKAHPAHAETSSLVAEIIRKAIVSSKMPDSVFQHVHGKSFETGKFLVLHEKTKAVGFTGSFQGGKQLFDWANSRKIPIPVFAEMGSVNPVFLFPGKMKESAVSMAELYASSITLGVGQFCTNPGLIIGLKGQELDLFECRLSMNVSRVAPAKMLHTGIAASFMKLKSAMLSSDGVHMLTAPISDEDDISAAPCMVAVSATDFLSNPLLHREVFGPFSMIVRCENLRQMKEVAANLEGQITSTIMANDEDVLTNGDLISIIQDLCGRFIFNGVPTGVEVCSAMHHGGPFPASTDSRFSSVGADGIRRFTRPIAFQNWKDEFLPVELRNKNSLELGRWVNDRCTTADITP